MKVFYIVFLLLTSMHAMAGKQLEQKLIIVKNQQSALMKGDIFLKAINRPHNFNKKAALPFFLSRGWQIKSVHINEKSTEESLYGYIVIEKLPTLQ